MRNLEDSIKKLINSQNREDVLVAVELAKEQCKDTAANYVTYLKCLCNSK